MKRELKKLTLGHFFSAIVEDHTRNRSIGFVGEEPITYGELGKRVTVLKIFLGERGIRRGDKVIILGENSSNWAVAYFAITTMGAVAIPILSDFPESDINHIIHHSEAAAAFVDERMFHYMDLNALESIREVFSLNSFAILKKDLPKTDNFWERLQKFPDKIFESGQAGERYPSLISPDDIREDDLAEILYTSGTTGHSKGVMLTHKNLVTNALAAPRALGGVNESSVILTLLPLAHAYGCTTTLVGGLSAGASLYFLTRKPSPKVLMDAMQQVRPTIVVGVPLVLEKVYHKKVLPLITDNRAVRLATRITIGRKLLYRKIGKKVLESFGGRLQSFVIGGASLNNEVENFLIEAGIPYCIGYGLSECSPLVAAAAFPKLRFGSVGQVIPDVEVKIDEPDPETGVGEIMVKGNNVMKGYYKNTEETKKVLLKDDWLRTGDLGYLDPQKNLFIKGRSKNVYVGPSGENIYPENVEDKLRESLYVEEALAYVEEGKVVGRIYLDYDYIQTVLNAPKRTIRHGEIDKILENVRRETNVKLPSFSQISRLLEQPEPFEKTPTNKIKRALYVSNYLNT